MSTPINVALSARTEAAHDAATRWPQLSEREVNRLRFLAYRRQTGRILPPAPVRAEMAALCATLLADLAAPAPEPPAPVVAGPRPAATRSPSRRDAVGGIPLTWAAWAEKYGSLRPDRIGSRRYPSAG